MCNILFREGLGGGWRTVFTHEGYLPVLEYYQDLHVHMVAAKTSNSTHHFFLRQLVSRYHFSCVWSLRRTGRCWSYCWHWNQEFQSWMGCWGGGPPSLRCWSWESCWTLQLQRICWPLQKRGSPWCLQPPTAFLSCCDDSFSFLHCRGVSHF